MSIEVELKFVVRGPGPLERLAAVQRLGPARLGPAARVDELDRYLDTAGGRIAAAMWACRLRSRDGTTIVSLKGPAEPGGRGALHRRPELEGPARDTLDAASWPHSAAHDFLDRLRGGEPLVERLALVQDRIERAVLIAGTAIGTLSLDRVEVQLGCETLGELQIVELELLPGTPEAPLGALAAALESIDGLTPDPMTKLERAISMLVPGERG